MKALRERLQSFVGVTGEPYVARDRVNEAMIRHWCEALGDANPIYTDPDFAARSAHGGIVAPPAMMNVWTMRGQQPQPQGEAPRARLIGLLGEAGFTSVIATNSELEFQRYLHPGDLVTASTTIEAVSDQKETALGLGHFITYLTTYRDESGEVVGSQRFRLLIYKPKAGVAEAEDQRPRPAVNADSAFFWEGARRGELLIQRCSSCRVLRHPPRPMCGACGSLEWDTVRSSGRGEVYSFVVHHYPAVPGFTPPYVVALIELEEGTRLVSNLVDVAPADARIGMPVEVLFVAVDDELSVPQFAPVGARR